MISQMLCNLFIAKFSKQFRPKIPKELKLEDSVGEELHVDFKMWKYYLSDCVISARYIVNTRN